MIKVYGIPNCDTVKKAIDFLKKNKIDFEFHNYKKDSITAAKLKEWCKQKGWEMLLNKRSSTWKNIMAADNGTVDNEAEAVKIMLAYTSIIKRPVIEYNDTIIVGFNEKEYLETILNNKVKK